VDTGSPAFLAVKELREHWLAAEPGEDSYRTPAPISLDGEHEEDRPLTLLLNSLADSSLQA
jgi:diphosphate-dependent phosphofructokinase